MVVVVAEHTSAVADPAAEVVPAAVHTAAEAVAVAVAVVVPVAVHKQPAAVEAGSEHIPAEPAAAVVPVAVHKQPAEVEAEYEHIPAFAAVPAVVPAAVPKSAVAAAVPVHHLLLLRILNRISHYLQSVIRTVNKTYKLPLYTKKHPVATTLSIT